jgi:hypothetical protein
LIPGGHQRGAAPNHRFKFQKRSQLFMGVYDEALSVAAMRISNEDRSSLAVHGCNTAPRSAGFAEIVNAQS